MDIAIKKNTERLIEIKDTFKIFSDPLDMIAYLIDIGKGAHNISNNEKTNDFNFDDYIIIMYWCSTKSRF